MPDTAMEHHPDETTQHHAVEDDAMDIVQQQPQRQHQQSSSSPQQTEKKQALDEAQAEGNPAGAGGGATPAPAGMIRRTIRPSRSKTKLMRQVSALGMEDPVFRTTEEGPEHPSNIFDDMGANHVPSDMMDMVSIASDPTAVMGEGCDLLVFQMSLSLQHGVDTMRPSLLEFGNTSASHSLNHSRKGNSINNHNHTRTSLLDIPGSNPVPISPDPKESDNIQEEADALLNHLYPDFAPSSRAAAVVLPSVQRKSGIRPQSSHNQINTTAAASNLQSRGIKKSLSRSFSSCPYQPTTTTNTNTRNSSKLYPYQNHHIGGGGGSNNTSPVKSSNATSSLRLVHKPSHEHMNASLPSLDLDAIFGASSSSAQQMQQQRATASALGASKKPRQPNASASATHLLHNHNTATTATSHMSSSVHTTASKNTAPTSTTTSHHASTSVTTDTLLAEAAVALEEQGSMCLELIEAAKRQLHHTHSNTTSATSSPSRASQPKRNVSRRHSTGIYPIHENNTTLANMTGTSMTTPRRPRFMPTLSGLFPGGTGTSTSNSKTPSRTPSSDSSATRTSTAASSFGRRKSADGDYATLQKMHHVTSSSDAYQPHQSWNFANVK